MKKFSVLNKLSGLIQRKGQQAVRDFDVLVFGPAAENVKVVTEKAVALGHEVGMVTKRAKSQLMVKGGQVVEGSKDVLKVVDRAMESAGGVVLGAMEKTAEGIEKGTQKAEEFGLAAYEFVKAQVKREVELDQVDLVHEVKMAHVLAKKAVRGLDTLVFGQSVTEGLRENGASALLEKQKRAFDQRAKAYQKELEARADAVRFDNFKWFEECEKSERAAELDDVWFAPLGEDGLLHEVFQGHWNRIAKIDEFEDDEEAVQTMQKAETPEFLAVPKERTISATRWNVVYAPVVKAAPKSRRTGVFGFMAVAQSGHKVEGIKSLQAQAQAEATHIVATAKPAVVNDNKGLLSNQKFEKEMMKLQLMQSAAKPSRKKASAMIERDGEILFV